MLNKKNIENIFDVTPLQEGLLFHYLKGEQHNQQNFEQICLYMRGKLDLGLFSRAWDLVVRNNEMLRTAFRWKRLNRPVQVTLKENPIHIHFTDLADLSPDLQEAAIMDIKSADKARLFDLEDTPFRVNAILLSGDRFMQIISNHSIIYDGWSNGILIKEFFTAYLDLLASRPVSLPSKGQFSDFVRVIKKRNTDAEMTYWSKYLAGKTEKNDLLIRSYPSKDFISSSNWRLTLEDELVKEIKTFCSSHKLTEATVFYTAWGVLLQKISNSKDVLFGTTVSGRSAGAPGIENLVGLLINTLPLRVDSRGKGVLELVRQVAADLHDRELFEHTPFLKIKEYGNFPLNEDLFETIVLIENYPLDLDIFKKHADCRIESFSFDQTNNFDIALSILNFENKTDLYFGYNNSKYGEREIKQLAGYFARILTQMIHHPNQEISRIELVSPTEKEEITGLFNDTKTDYPSDKYIHQLFEERVDANPHQIALIFGDQQISYGCLNKMANRIAGRLKVGAGDGNILIPVILDRSPEMIGVLLGILKAGYAYVPFEPSLPKARIEKMLQSLSVSLVIDERSLPGLLERRNEEDDFEGKGENDDNEIAINAGLSGSAQRSNEDIAYIIHTSGSTGLPKGVVVQHKPVINILDWINKTFQVGKPDRVLFITSLGFDLSVYDIFGSLAAGATIYIANREEIGNPQALLDVILKEKITIWDSAPAAFQQVLQVGQIAGRDMRGNMLRLVMMSGDWIGLQIPGMAAGMFSQAQLVSLGGATEAVIWSNYFLFDRVEEGWTSIPYGKPVQNARYYILDDDLNPLPKGIIGDLYIGGDCLAIGYVNEISLTRGKFIDSPFPGAGKLYRTGDLARFFEDGNIELIGRKDFQIKIRGFRVELGEIEGQILKYPGIKDLAVLIDKNVLNEKYISAFYTADEYIGADTIRTFLRAELPDYMIPAYMIRVEAIPVTMNGKVDRGALLRLIAHDKDNSIKKPVSDAEIRIARIWADVLNYDPEKIGQQSDFFEIGGHSLNATILQARIEKEFDITIPLRHIFNFPVLEAFAKCIPTAMTGIMEIPGAPEQEYYPVTSGQKRLYSLYSLHEQSTTYNISGCLKLQGRPDTERISAVAARIIQTQESLRTSFAERGHEIVQIVHPAVPFALQRIRVSDDMDPDQFASFIKPFDLGTAPLFRLSLLETDAGTSYLLLDMHHIISDGLSVNKFLADFALGYNGGEILPPLIRFRDYAVWANSAGYFNKISGQERFWLDQFRDGFQRLRLPLDYERPSWQQYEGDHIDFQLPPGLTEGISRLEKDSGATLFMVILAIYNVLLAKTGGQEEIIIGTPVVSRPHADLLSVIGFFVNTVALKNSVNPDASFKSLLAAVKENTIGAFENQDYPFERLASKIDGRRDPGYNPVFDVMLEFDNLDLTAPVLNGLKTEIMPDIARRAKFDLTLGVYPAPGSIRFRIGYSTLLFDPGTIIWMRDCFLQLTEMLIDHPDRPIKDIDIFRKKGSVREPEIEFNF
jgi:tyrocidine synthetase III